MEITEKAKDMQRAGADIISFSAGEPDFRTPENICAEGIRAIEEGLTKYTKAAGMNELKEAVCRKFREFNQIEYRPSQIVISNGGKHSLSNAFTALLNEGDEVIIPAPYWVTYSESAKLNGGRPVIVTTRKENDYKLTAEELLAACTEKTKCLVLNTPNNPTGMIYSRKELEAIAAIAVEKDFYVIADEVYESLCYEGLSHVSIASLNKEIYERTITISALSKSYAMTGWRIGYAGAPEQIAKVMGSIQSQQTSNPNTIAQIAAIEALSGDQSRVKEMVAAYDERRQYVYDRVRGIKGLSCVKPLGAFYVFADVSGFVGKSFRGHVIENAADFASHLLNDYYVAVIPCADFGFPEHIRISYSTGMETLAAGLDRMEKYCGGIM